MNLSPIALAHLSAIVLAAGERIKAIRKHSVDSIEANLASIEYSRACIAINTDKDITDSEWESVYTVRRAIEETIAQECQMSYAAIK